MTTYPNENQKVDDYKKFQEEQDWYFSALSKNGQILMKSCTTVFDDSNFTTYFLAPENDSLDINNDNIYVKRFYSEFMAICREKPDLKMLAKSSDYPASCKCESPSWYMLYTDHLVSESPVVCGNCENTVPLYKLPKILKEDEYFSVLNWQKAYNACDTLFMNGIAERLAYQRLSKVTSDLSVLGRNICKEFELATGKSFFYYLFRYKSHHKAACPICGKHWELDNNNQLFIDYRCDDCRIVADKVKK